MEDLKTYGAVEMTLGLLDVSLGAILLKVDTFFKKEIFVIFISGAWTILTGLCLVCGGRKPSYACVKLNVALNLGKVILTAVTFGTMVRHVPYQQHRYCKESCSYVKQETMVLVGGIVAILVTVFLVEMLVSLAVVLTGLCSMLPESPLEPVDPECPTTTRDTCK